jgi:predicted Zn-dependent peptidase
VRLTEIPNALGETILGGTAPSGLRVLVNPRPGWSRTFAALATNFGSVDRVDDASGQPVPEGLAHFLEHKLFEDRDGDVSDRFAALGASTNAMTGFVSTTYITSTVEQPGKCLDLLLDFVQDPWFTDALVAKEQGIIAQEIRMYDDDPDWRAFFGLLDCLYERHPVKDNIAGSVQSIADIDAATLRRCYELFYHPRNLFLVVSGALPVDEIVSRVLADQASRPADERPAHERGAPPEPATRRAERVELALPVSRPRLLLGIKDGVLGGDGRDVSRRELCTRVLLDLLFGSSSSTYERLYSSGLVDETFSASHTADASFGFSTLGGDTDDPERLLAELRGVFERARREGVDRAAFRRVQHKLLGGLLRGLDSPEQTAYLLLGESMRGLLPFEELELLSTITPEQLDARLAELWREDAVAVSIVRPLADS